MVGQIEHGKDELCVGELGVGAFDTDAFDGVIAVPETGGVDETEQYAAEVASFFDRVAGRTGNVRNQGAVLTDERVQ